MAEKQQGDVLARKEGDDAWTELEASAREAGFDLATIRERLRMSPSGRLRANTRGWRLVQMFRRAGTRERARSASGS